MPTINSNTDHNSWQTVTSSIVGGAAGGFLFFPAEGLKKRLQSDKLHAADFRNLSTGNLRQALHPRELFRGSSAFATSVMVATVTSMAFNRAIKELSFYDDSSSAHRLVAAFASGALGAIVGSTPVENTILTQQSIKKGPIPAVQHMLKQGISRPWVGVCELMARESIFAGVMLFGAPAARNYIKEKTNSDVQAELGAVGVGVIGALASHPFDTTATYRQSQDGQIPLRQAVENIYKKSGIQGFYKGGACRVILFTGCAISIPKISKIVENVLNGKAPF